MSESPIPDPFTMVAEALSCTTESLSENSRLDEHSSWDSFGHLNVMLALETYYGVAIDDETIREYESFAKIIELHQKISGDVV